MDSIRKIPVTDLPLLSEIPDAPEHIYVCGSIPTAERKLLCVVGARKYSEYGESVCQKLIESLSGEQVAIVSGLAMGIDAIAHASALNAGLQTFAVPGSGLDKKVLYPRTHVGLAQKIIEAGGGLLSEFEPTFRATQWSFPKRNRIMAGLCHATLIIEAGRKSGTLITGRLAMEYNRDVLTVPGSIFSNTSEGPHYLIRNGATPISSTDDLRDALGLSGIHSAPRAYTPENEYEGKIITILTHSPIERDELVRSLSLPAHLATIHLMGLEIKGIICESEGYIRLT